MGVEKREYDYFPSIGCWALTVADEQQAMRAIQLAGVKVVWKAINELIHPILLSLPVASIPTIWHHTDSEAIPIAYGTFRSGNHFPYPHTRGGTSRPV